MDPASWYASKEMPNCTFSSYYNNSYQYTPKNMVPYMDSRNCHNIDLQDNNISGIEIGAIESNKDFGNDPEDFKAMPKKTGCKLVQVKKQKGSIKKEKGIIKYSNPPIEPLKPAPCRGQYKHSECDKVSDEDRYSIYREFQKLNNSQSKWQFIASHVYVHAKSKSTSNGPSRRENTHHYYLTVSGQKVKVCRKFFLTNLNISEAVIRTSLEKLSPQGICQDDNRGRKPPPNKLSATDEHFVRKHVLSFPPIEENHCKGKISKKYLHCSLSISSMHKMYVNVCKDHDRKPISVETYRRICKEYNICFLKPSKDQNKKIFTTQHWPKDQPESLEHTLLPFKLNEPMFMTNDSLSQRTNPQSNFSITSYLLGVEAARDLNDRSSTYFPALEKRPSPVDPQTSFDNDFQTESDQNSTVLEIGAMRKPPVEKPKKASPSKGSTRPRNKSSPKLKRLKGESYVDSKGVLRPPRPMKPSPCRGQYKHSECDTVSEKDRAQIYKEFRNLRSSQAQWQFIASHVHVHAKSKSTAKGPSRRENTHHYYLTVARQKVRVCRKFFLATLNVSEAMIRTALEKLSPQGICEDDNRGRKAPPNKLSVGDDAFLREHILSFRPVEAGFYGRKNVKKFLDASLSFAMMHKMYVNVCKEQTRKHVSVETYRRVCKEYNISFVKQPQRDPGRKCLSHPDWCFERTPKQDPPSLLLKEYEEEREEALVHRHHPPPVVSFAPKPTPPPPPPPPQDATPSLVDFDLQSLLCLPEGP